MSREKINDQALELFKECENDLIDKIPRNLNDAPGIWILSSKA